MRWAFYCNIKHVFCSLRVLICSMLDGRTKWGNIHELRYWLNSNKQFGHLAHWWQAAAGEAQVKLMQLMMAEFHLIASAQRPDIVHAGSMSHCLGQLNRTEPSLMISATPVQSNSMTVCVKQYLRFVPLQWAFIWSFHPHSVSLALSNSFSLSITREHVSHWLFWTR